MEHEHGHFRCERCGKLLAKEDVEKGYFEVKCARCGLLNTIFKTLKDQIIITDPKGIILYVNDAVELITGYSSDEIIGNTPALWGKQMPKVFYEALWDTISNKKQSISVRVTNKHKDGHLYEALLRISPILDPQGDIRYFVGIETTI